MEQKKSYNLCSTYMLPLLRLKKWDFNVNTSATYNDNFENAYISEDNKHIIVEVRHHIVPKVIASQSYRFKFSRDGKNYGVFEFPKVYEKELIFFRQGKYSQFSDTAKKMIRDNSALIWQRPNKQGGVDTDVKLMVLYKDETLRRNLEQKLDVKIDKDAELGEIPGDNNFYELNVSDKLELQD